MNRRHAIAAAVAAGCMLLLLITLAVAKLSVSPEAWPPQPRTTSLVELDEEFVEMFDPAPVNHNPAPAYAPSPSPVKEATPVKEPTPTKEASTKASASTKAPPAEKTPVAELPREEQNDVVNAFAASDKAAANSSQPAEQGGAPDGTTSTIDGTGSGQVGGGWIMPHYKAVPSHLTGSVELRATIDSGGKVIKVELTGGKAPAAANSALVNKCMAEVRRHRFERTDDNPPERAYARIIYNFR